VLPCLRQAPAFDGLKLHHSFSKFMGHSMLQ
jgi:hypothetical protein